MRLYNTEGATQVDDPEFGTFKPGANGAFDGLPDGMYAKLHGRPGWEDEAQRVARLAAEQLEKMRDPATMLAELQKMSSGQGALTALLAQALGVAPASVPAQSDVPAEPSETVESPAETPAQDAKSEPQTPTEAAEATETVATTKSTSGRGRGAKATKTAASDAS